jgi:putative ABC transport system substrate-binding protein
MMLILARPHLGRWLARLSVFPLAIVVFAPLVTVNAQQAKKIYRIGVLSELAPTAGAAGGPRPLFGEDTWRTAFRQRGYVEGQDIFFEFRHAGEHFERLPQLADELVRAKVDIIVAVTTPTALAAKRMTGVIPIITVSADPVGANLVTSLARPGGNVTGLFVPWSDLTAKGLQLVREAVPDLDKVAILWNPLNQTAHVGAQKVESAAKSMGIGTQRIEMRRQEDLDQISKAIMATRVRGLVVALDLVTVRAAPSIAQLATKHRLPGFHAYREFAEAGGLMSYGFTEPGLAEATVEYADKVLRGARPADLPMEQPMRNEFVLNLKTAKTLGLKISPSLLGRASHVIE